MGPEKAAKYISPIYLKEIEQKLSTSLQIIETKILGDVTRLAQAESKGQFNWIAGVGEQPTLADLSAVCELY